MKRPLLFGLLATCGLWSIGASAQTRYLDEVFDDNEIVVHSDITFGTNIDFLVSDLSDPLTVQTEATELQTAIFLGNPIPPAYFNPADESTSLKVKDIKMDIYEPDQSVDTFDERPVMVYIHTGNFLPPPINGSPNGLKTDSVAVELCRRWARRGYVAVSVDYRLGWNPIAETIQERRGTLLNAVYRAIHDVKEAVRYMRGDALAANTYAIDESKIVLYGQGSGGYVAQAYTTLDDAAVELFLPKFLPNPFDPNTSYVDTLIVGDIEGFNGALTLYQDEGLTSEVHMSINAGGALADESWLEAGDVPMCSINCIRDDFAPFNEGIVIVPTTLEEVVPVHGANFFIQKANDLGNNDAFANLPGDPYTDRARSLYGQTFDVSLGGSVTINESPEGLFPLELPLTSYLTNQASPWEWWNPTSPLALFEVAPGVTAHMASLSSNPDMSPEKGRAYCDTINGYILPRIMCALDLPGAICAPQGPDNDMCMDAASIDELFGTGPNNPQLSDPFSNVGATNDGDPADGWECFGEPDGGGASPSIEQTVWFSFMGDGLTYNIQSNDCNGTLGDDYIFQGDTQFAVYTGDCGDLVPVACNEDSPDAVNGNYFAELEFQTEDGVMYYMMVDGFDWTDLGDAPAEGSFCLQVNQIVVSVEEVAAKTSFEVFPNPASDVFTIRATEQIQAVNLYNVVGELVDQLQGSSSNALEINAEAYAPGVYMVNVKTASGMSTARLVIE